jgi:hypothetical protein
MTGAGRATFGSRRQTADRTVVSDQCEQVSECHFTLPSSGKLTPFGQRGRAVPFEDFAAVEMTVEVEVVVDRGMDGSKLLKGLDVPESCHGPFSSPERLV